MNVFEETKVRLDSLEVVFNYNRPTDKTAIINDLCTQREAGALSIKSFIEHSPYTTNADVEMGRIKEEMAEIKANNVIYTDSSIF